MKEYIYQNKFVLQIYKLKKISQWNFSEDFYLFTASIRFVNLKHFNVY